MSMDFWLKHFKANNNDRFGAGAQWLDTLRERALDRFVSEGWPNNRTVGWRHTSLALMQQNEFNMPGKLNGTQDQISARIQELRADSNAYYLVFIDGKFIEGLSSFSGVPQGAVVMSMSAAFSDHADEIRSIIDNLENSTAPAALNLALASDGAFIKLNAGVELDKPVNLIFVSSGTGSYIFPRSVIVADTGAQAVVTEYFISMHGNSAEAAANLTNAVTHIRVANNAQVTHAKLQQENEQDYHLASIDALQGEASVFNSHSLSFGARLARNDISTRFNGEKCETLLNGFYYVNARRHVDHNTLIDHAQPNGISREYYRGILDDASRGVFGGRILVAPGADGTDSAQRSDSMLLSRMARADAKPELEIYADDVQCAHGATVGQLDDDAMFYLRSRGLDSNFARNLLIYAFAAEVIERINIDSMRNRVAGLIRERLPDGELLGEVA